MKDNTPWHICLVDDDPDISRLVAATLERAGMRVSAFTDPTTALTAIESIQPDMTILDVEMPGKSGFELCAEIAARPALKGMPIVFLTSRSSQKFRNQGISAGAVDYVLKPFQMRDLLSSVHAVLTVSGDWKRGTQSS